MNRLTKYGVKPLALAYQLAKEGVRTRRDLRRPHILKRLPRDLQAKILFNPKMKIPLAEATIIANKVKNNLVIGNRHFKVIPVGGIRRQKLIVKDLDFLIVVPLKVDHVLAQMELLGSPSVVFDYAMGVRKRSCILKHGKHTYRSDFFVTTEAEVAYALFHHTGSSRYNIRIRKYAKKFGWLLNQYGLFNAVTRRRVRGTSSIRTEEDLARFLGITIRPPQDRNY